jgi:hypothetical protein
MATAEGKGIGERKDANRETAGYEHLRKRNGCESNMEAGLIDVIRRTFVRSSQGMMIAAVVAKARSAKSITVDYVDKTDTWTRPTNYPSTNVKAEFSQVVEDNASSLHDDTAKVAMKYAFRSCVASLSEC